MLARQREKRFNQRFPKAFGRTALPFFRVKF
jgi:hypothetical protein